MHTLAIDLILVEDRQRKDLGDIDELKESIKRFGIIQPLVVDAHNRLIAGGRRLTACKALGLTEVPVYFRESMTEQQLTMLEMEENLRRKEMTWQEQVLGIAKVHRLRANEEAAEGRNWTREQTGQWLGVSAANISYTLKVARELANQGSAMWACTSFSDALRWLAIRKEDEVRKSLALDAKMASEPRSTAKATLVVPGVQIIETKPTDSIDVEPVPDTRGGIEIRLSDMAIHGNCLEIMSSFPDGHVDHIITDPPYAINVEMLNQQNPNAGMVDLERIRDTHDEEGNRKLLRMFLPEAFRVTKDRSFVVFWCDVMNWGWLHDLAVQTGFAVQRWPLIWKKVAKHDAEKVGKCINQTAAYNFTKDYEMAMVCRKKGATLVTPQRSSIVACPSAGYISNPFAKPMEAWDFIIRAVSITGQSILDPFAGEGSCPMSVLSTSRRPIGIELEEIHYNTMLSELKRKCDIMFRKPTYI